MNPIQNKNIAFQDLGMIDYRSAWDYQEKLFQEIIAIKTTNRNSELSPSSNNTFLPTKNYLLFCEHSPVFTIGKSGKMNHLLASTDVLNEKKISFFQTNRGGDITFHGPEQIVGYPIIDLENFFTDIGKYMRFLEEVIIKTLAEYGLQGERSPGETGVWLDVGKHNARKICAMGVRSSRWVTMHGWAFNINTDLSYFDLIIPCGITNKGVTSLQNELGKYVDLDEVKEKLFTHFEKIFEAKISSQNSD
jgi:lipoyl(octanoyl) transferase